MAVEMPANRSGVASGRAPARRSHVATNDRDGDGDGARLHRDGGARHEKFRIVGTVTKRQATEIQVKTQDGTKFTIYLDEHTVVQRDKKKVPNAQLKLGQSVVVDALGDGDDDLGAQVVNIVPAIKPSSSPKTRPAPRG